MTSLPTPPQSAPTHDAAQLAAKSGADKNKPVDAAPEAPPPTFDVLALSADLRATLAEMGYVHPTPVQIAVFEPAKRGKDLVVQARTGTGKTAAFGLPIVDHIVKRSVDKVQVLTLCPTRELALQVGREIERLGQRRGVKVIAIYGGAPMQRQIDAINAGAQVVCGTPGRVLDHLRRGTLDAKNVRLVVLDESDEMLSMGFERELNAILEFMPPERQTLLFSATLPPDIERIARNKLKTPEFVTLSGDHVGALSIQHYVYMVNSDKTQAFLRMIEVENPESAIVFCNTKDQTEALAGALQRQGYEADWLNGDLDQGERERVMAATREGRIRFLVCTDVAARGIDISHLTHVINFDFPQDAESYVHRTGRTGRAGRTGLAIAMVTPQDIGGLYLLRLTYKIRPIEKQIPSDSDLKTRAETDLVAMFAEAYGGKKSVHPDDLSLARRLMTHDNADFILAGLLRDHLGARPTAKDEASAGRRAAMPRPADRGPKLVSRTGNPLPAATRSVPAAAPAGVMAVAPAGVTAVAPAAVHAVAVVAPLPHVVVAAPSGVPHAAVPLPHLVAHAPAPAAPSPAVIAPAVVAPAPVAAAPAAPVAPVAAARESAPAPAADEAQKSAAVMASSAATAPVAGPSASSTEVVVAAAQPVAQPAVEAGGRGAGGDFGGRGRSGGGDFGGRGRSSAGGEPGGRGDFGGRGAGGEPGGRGDFGGRGAGGEPGGRGDFGGRGSGSAEPGGRRAGLGGRGPGGEFGVRDGAAVTPVAGSPVAGPDGRSQEGRFSRREERGRRGRERDGRAPRPGSVAAGVAAVAAGEFADGARDRAAAGGRPLDHVRPAGEPGAAPKAFVRHSDFTTWQPPEEEGDDEPIWGDPRRGPGGPPGAMEARPVMVPHEEPVVAAADAASEPLRPPGEVVELHVTVGRRDGARASELVRALEKAGLPKDSVQRVRVRERHTFLSVRKEDEERALAALNGVTIGTRVAAAERARERQPSADGAGDAEGGDEPAT